MKDDAEFPELAEENRRIWNANAKWWDDRIGDGNAFQEVLIEPATERLLEISPGHKVLDIACGAGRTARKLTGLGAQVTGIDYSSEFIDRARLRGKQEGIEVTYHVMDAANEEALETLGRRRFDRAVCTMALMDMPCIEPLMRALHKLLKTEGLFVFSTIHPCFHSTDVQRFMEICEDERGRHITRRGVKVYKYKTPEARKTEGIIGQPEPQYYFHRPLHILLNAAFQAGFVADALEEPSFSYREESSERFRWMDMPEIPPILVVRMRPAGKDISI